MTDWSTLSSVATVLTFVCMVVWTVYDRHKQSRREEVGMAQDNLSWKLSIETKIEDLKKEIEHRKEFDCMVTRNQDARLDKAEKQLDEVLSLLIQVYQEEASARPGAGPGSRP